MTRWKLKVVLLYVSLIGKNVYTFYIAMNIVIPSRTIQRMSPLFVEDLLFVLDFLKLLFVFKILTHFLKDSC